MNRATEDDPTTRCGWSPVEHPQTLRAPLIPGVSGPRRGRRATAGSTTAAASAFEAPLPSEPRVAIEPPLTGSRERRQPRAGRLDSRHRRTSAVVVTV